MEDLVNVAEGRRSRGLDRAFEILHLLRTQRQPMRPNEIARALGSPRSSVYELVNLLLRHGALEYRGEDGRVFLGRTLLFLGNAYAEQVDLLREGTLMLDRIALETRETAQLCMLEGNKYTVALMREGPRPFRISANVGELVPIPWTATGRLMLSHMTATEILAFVPQEDFILPNGTQLDPSRFIREAHQARRDGFFTFDSEVETFTHCLGVPVRNASGIWIAALCIVAPREDGLRNRDAYLRSLLSAARDLSEHLGYAPSAEQTTRPFG